MDTYKEQLMMLCGKNVDVRLRGKVEVNIRGMLTYDGDGRWRVESSRARLQFTQDTIYSLVADQIVL